MDVTEPVVRTAAGQVRGRAENGVAVFRGIPFAQPPVGALRFAAPQPARPWDGVREADMFGPPPPQSAFMLGPTAPVAPGADPDDWLTVNVFSPDPGGPGTFFSPELAADVTAAIAAEAGLPSATEAFAAADPAWLTAASDAVNPADHEDRWGPAGRTGVSFSPVVDGEVLPAAPWQAIAAGAGRGVDLVAGYNRDEYRLFTALNGQRGKITEEVASDTLRGLAGGRAGEAAYREAYPDADAEMLFELVNSDWLFRMPTLHLAQAHAAAGGKTFLFQVSFEATEGGFGACHGIVLPLVFGVYSGLGEFLFGPEPPASAVALGDLIRSQWAAFASGGDPGSPPYSPGSRLTRIFDDPPDVLPYPEGASLHLWDQHRFGVLDLRA